MGGVLAREGMTLHQQEIQFASYTFKNLILETLSKLKHAEQKYKNVIVAHDMTQTEREECRKLVEKAKADRENDTSGEYLGISLL